MRYSDLLSIYVNRECADILYRLDVYTVGDLVQAYSIDPAPLRKLPCWKELQQLIGQAESVTADALFQPAADLVQKVAAVPRVSTGSETLNAYIDPDRKEGVLSGTSIEFFGEASSGKSEFAATVAASAFLPVGKGGLAEPGRVPTVYVVDTEGPWAKTLAMVWKVAAILRGRYGIPEQVIGTDLRLSFVPTVDALVQSLRALVRDAEHPSVVIVDSLSAPFRLTAPADQFRYRNIKYSEVLDLLKELMAKDVTVVITNQVYQVISGYLSNVKEVYGGEKVKHFATYRVQLRRAGKTGKFSVRRIKLVDVIGAPEDEVDVILTDVGVVDAKYAKRFEEYIERKREELKPEVQKIYG